MKINIVLYLTNQPVFYQISKCLTKKLELIFYRGLNIFQSEWEKIQSFSMDLCYKLLIKTFLGCEIFLYIIEHKLIIEQSLRNSKLS